MKYVLIVFFWTYNGHKNVTMQEFENENNCLAAAEVVTKHIGTHSGYNDTPDAVCIRK